MRAISSHVPDAIVVFSRTRCDRCLLTKAISCLEFGDQRSEGGDGIVIASRTSRTGLNSDRTIKATPFDLRELVRYPLNETLVLVGSRVAVAVAKSPSSMNVVGGG
nr:hypothetical protein Iba_chr10bCG9820 [Ipomoea batatas]